MIKNCRNSLFGEGARIKLNCYRGGHDVGKLPNFTRSKVCTVVIVSLYFNEWILRFYFNYISIELKCIRVHAISEWWCYSTEQQVTLQDTNNNVWEVQPMTNLCFVYWHVIYNLYLVVFNNFSFISKCPTKWCKLER